MQQNMLPSIEGQNSPTVNGIYNWNVADIDIKQQLL